jgi:hypothetical protein
MKKRTKLDFNKKVISSLSDAEQKNVVGGDAPATTSFVECSGWSCCKETASLTLTTVLLSLANICADPPKPPFPHPDA